MALLTVQDLTIGYESHAILAHLNFEVQPGDCLCVVGENGSGKSTLMRTLLGLQKPLAGTIRFGDGLRENEIGYLPQQTAIQKDFPATVWEIVLSGCQARVGNRPFYGRSEKARAEKNLELMGMTSYKKRCFRMLSGGQQQRVLLARALCATEKLLLMDEPVSGLDPKVSKELYELIDRLNRRDGVSIVMISHDIDEVERHATHMLHLGSGEAFYGTTAEYLRCAMRRFAPKGGAQA